MHTLGGGGGGVGVNSPQKPKKCEKNGGFTFYTANNTYRTQIYPVIMWIQIHASGGGGGGGEEFFLLKRCNTAHSECSQIRYHQPKNQQF